MSQLVPKTKGSIVAGATLGGNPGFVEVPAGADNTVLAADSTTPSGLAYKPVSVASGLLDPRDIFRFSMFHNVGVTGGG